jgi:hypothetical protein
MGPFGIIYADATIGRAAPNRLQATAFVNVGINEHPSASAWLLNVFRAPGDGGTVTAQVSTDVSWHGVIAGNGAAGTGASVTITLAVMDDATTVASTVVHAREIRESALSIGGIDAIGSAPANLTVILQRGRLYELRLTVTCEATSGLIGAATHCIFGPSEVYDDGYVDWGTRTILFAE